MTSLTGGTGMLSGGGRTGNKVSGTQRVGQIQQYTPEQMELLQQGMSNVGPNSYLSKLAAGDQSMFEEMEAPAMRQFSALQGNIASRFSGKGTGGRRSSGFQNEMNSASSNFAQDLQSQRLGLRNEAVKQLHSMSQQLLGNQPYEQFTYDKQQKESGWKKWAPLAGGVIGAGVGLMGGPGGAVAGYQAGNAVAGAF